MPSRIMLPDSNIIIAYSEGKSTVQIASKFGCGQQTINRRLKKNGIKLRSQSEAHIDLQCGPKNGFFGKHHDDKTKQVMSELKKGKKLSEYHRQKLAEAHKGLVAGEKNPQFGAYGSKNPNWRGGTRSWPYCSKFNHNFKESIRDQFNRCCFICGMPETENGRCLDIHHILGYKS